jgi:hypothetical protein
VALCTLVPAATATAASLRVPVDVPTITAAIAASAPGDTIRLVGNGASTYPERLIIDKDLTLEGGWRADFTVRDPSLYVSVVRDTTGTFQRSVIRVTGSPRVVLDGIWILSGRLGIEATAGPDLIIRDCVIRSQQNDRVGFGDQPGGALYQVGGTLLMERTGVRNIVTWYPGGGIALDGLSSAVLRDCDIERTTTRPSVQQVTAPANGGGIWASGVADLLLERVDILQCASQFNRGGAVFAIGSAVRMNDCSVTEGFAGTSGGGIFAQDCPSLSLDGCTIQSCFGPSGGGIHAERVGSLSVTNCLIQLNRSPDEGAGLWIDASPFTLRDDSISANSSLPGIIPVKGGGARCLGSDGLVERTSFTGGNVSGSGGAWYQVGGQVTFRDCRFDGNHSNFYGGALHIELGGTIRIERSVLANNSGKFGGACSASFTGRFEMDRSTVARNSTTSQGAAFYLDTAAHATVTNSILCCATAGDLVHCSSSATVSVSFSDVWNDPTNVRAEFGGSCPDPTGTNGNKSEDPLFCDPNGPSFLLAGVSPCVGSASDGGNMGWTVGTSCRMGLSLERASWGSVKSRWRTARP